MAALARAVAVLLFRGGWLVGLVVLELLMLAAFWWSGPTAFGSAFDRRAAEADLLLLTLTSLPALFAGALLTSGDREDGMADFYRSCRVSPLRQTTGSALGLFSVTGGALAVALPASLLMAAPATLLTSSPYLSLVIGLVFTLIHGLWGLALGAWVGSRWAAVAAALGFWVVTMFALEALVTALLGVLPARWSLPLVYGLTVVDPTELARVISVAAKGQLWAYGPAFADLRLGLATPAGGLLLTLLVSLHAVVPGALAVAGARRSR